MRDPYDLPTKEELSKLQPRTIKVGIGFAVLNNFKGLAEAIHSVVSKHDTEIFIKDQWRNNRPLAQAWNELAMSAFEKGCDYALICNDDILFSPLCIDKMVDVHMRHDDEGVVMVTPNNIMLELSNPEDILSYYLPEDTPESNSDHPNFSCFLIAPDFFEKIGFFDENFIPAWFEDNDSHYRSKLLGYREICTNLAPMVHYGGVATSLMDNPSSQASHDYYLKKWGSVRRDGNEEFKTPYNDPTLTARDWMRPDGSIKKALGATDNE